MTRESPQDSDDEPSEEPDMRAELLREGLLSGWDSPVTGVMTTLVGLAGAAYLTVKRRLGRRQRWSR